MSNEPGTESPAMQAFLAERRVDVLRRAIAALDTCPDASLAAEAHRLAGTLGMFGFDDASAGLRDLEHLAEDATVASDSIATARASTMALLRGIESESRESGHP